MFDVKPGALTACAGVDLGRTPDKGMALAHEKSSHIDNGAAQVLCFQSDHGVTNGGSFSVQKEGGFEREGLAFFEQTIPTTTNNFAT